MVFLNPTILLGLLAASIPILIHLLNFRKLKKVEFSTLSFLKELQKSKIKKIKIKQWLLLLLRVLIIIFLVLAFARPTLENVMLPGSNSSAKSSVIFIIDNSFSMNYIGDDGSIFNKSKKIAKEIVAQMEDGDEFSILFSLDSIVTSTNKNKFLEIIDKFETNSITEITSQKISKAITFLEDSDNINKEIYLFSDFQKSTFNNNNVNDSLQSSIPENIRFFSFNLGLEKTNNISISNLTLMTAIPELNKPLNFEATVNNYSDEDIKNVTVSLFLNDKRVAQQNVVLEKNQSKNIYFETSLNNTGLINIKAQLEDDNILNDNLFHFNFWVDSKLKVLLLYDNEEDIFFIEAALNSSFTEGQLELVKSNTGNLIREQFDKYNTVILISWKVINNPELQKYLDLGGNLIFFPPSNISTEGLLSIQNVLNLPAFENITIAKSDDDFLEFDELNFDHPIFTSMFEKKIEYDIASPSITKSIKFMKSPNTNSIISLLDGSIFIGEYRLGNSEIIFFSTSPTLEWSNFPLKGIFAPLTTRLISYLTANQKQNKIFKTGDIIELDVSDFIIPLIDVELPNGRDIINLQNFSDRFYKYENTFQSGTYKFYNDNKLVYYSSVNPDPRESNLAQVNNEILLNYFNNLFDKNFVFMDTESNYIDNIKQARYGTELWKFFLLIALLLALLEMFVSRSTKKDLAKLN